jgi:hypothetical protein
MKTLGESNEDMQSLDDRCSQRKKKIAIRIANFETQITEFHLVKTNTITAVAERARQTKMFRCCSTESHGAAAVLRVMVQCMAVSGGVTGDGGRAYWMW